MSESKYRIGYFLDPKKVATFIQPSLINYAKQHSIDLIPIQPNQPLTEQFNCIIHKSYNPQWSTQLSQIRSNFPNLIIIDSPDAIQRLHNRKTMLQVLDGVKIGGSLRVETPRQVFVESPERVKSGSLDFPVIAKPLMANGSVGAHKMCLVFKEDGLGELEMDSEAFVLQEFVNHGGVIFKVYVAGKHVKCVKRKSLPDVSLEELGRTVNVLPFSQISNVSVGDQSDESVNKRIEAFELPPVEFVEQVAGELRKGLGLNLFNFDMIRDSRDGERYLVIDINYFPGYAKMPGFEKMFTDFLLDIVEEKESKVCENSESH